MELNVPRVRHTTAIVLCAGQGSRLGAPVNKVFLPLGDKPVIVATLNAFQSATRVDAIVIVSHPKEMAAYHEILLHNPALTKVTSVIPGGTTRHQSEWQALQLLEPHIRSGDIRTLLLHDGARPFVTPAEIDRLVEVTSSTAGATYALGAAATDLFVGGDASGTISETLRNDELWHAQTPQAFSASELLRAYSLAAADGFEGTDTASAIERLGEQVCVRAGTVRNFKITTPDDLVRARAQLASFRATSN